MYEREAKLIRPRIFLADNHVKVLEAVGALLQPHFELVGTATDGGALIQEVQRLQPDVVVVDVNMPVMSGIDAVEKLEESGTSTKFVFLTIHTEEEFVSACLKGGSRAYVWKAYMKGHLIPAINAVLHNLPYSSPTSRA
jgi:DNA-binding NarL/FixJ family response regulator